MFLLSGTTEESGLANRTWRGYSDSTGDPIVYALEGTKHSHCRYITETDVGLLPLVFFGCLTLSRLTILRSLSIMVRAAMKRCRLVGLMVKASASRAEDPEFESRLRRDFSGSSHTSDLKIGTPVDTLPGAWRCRVSAGTAWPGVSIL